MFKPLIIIGLSFAFVGCATTSSETASTAQNSKKQVAQSDEEKPKVICQKTHRVGTHFKKLQCWTKEEYVLKQQRDKEEVRQLQRSTMTPPEQ
ncbi:hypothetical protein [Kangiella shandongensis]|uniref:hypothetical protein n=1 Tax=Kangiella shandongensis TaxID=2763258 RepID=UPI001CBFE087|nr:hypothetical protein [Kangiella shandongensis]